MSESLFSDRVREGMDGPYGIRHNGNDHTQGPLPNCPRCVADGLLAEIQELRRDNEHAYHAWRELTEGRPS